MNTANKFVRFFSYFILTIASLSCIIPLVMIVSASFSSESAILNNGYGIFPQKLTLSAYNVIVTNSSALTRAYVVTIVSTVIGTILNVVITILTAYPLSRQDYVWKNKFNLYFYFTQIFSGGMIPAYIINTQYLGLKNSPLVLILPMLMSVWNVFLLRTYFRQVPTALIEAAKLDGASEWTILFKVVCPIAKAGIATIAVMVTLAFWNEWYTCLMYMSKDDYITLQYFLQKVLSNINALQNDTSGVVTDLSNMPNETARMALCVFAAGPMIAIFPFFQKYFVRGVALGSVK